MFLLLRVSLIRQISPCHPLRASRKFFPSQSDEEEDRGPGSAPLSAFDGREQINQAGTTEAWKRQPAANEPSEFTLRLVRRSPDPKTASHAPLYLEDLISFSFQVARGMEFLASRKV